MEEKIQALNYCAHAIEDLYQQAKLMKSIRAFQSEEVIKYIINMLEKSVKFILPNCAQLVLDDDNDIKQSHMDLMRLPFPCVSFEAPWDMAKELHQYDDFIKQQNAPKRIALCWDTDSEFEPVPDLLRQILERFSGGGVFVLPIFWGELLKQWEVSVAGIFIPFCNQVKRDDEIKTLPASEIAVNALRNAGMIKSTGKEPTIEAEPFIVLPEMFNRLIEGYKSIEQALAQILLESRDEGKMLIQACSVLNCSNVETWNLHAPDTLNLQRKKKGKQPFFSYKILQLKESMMSSAKSASGTHASPRTHLRRGHIRRYKDNKTTWVRASIVNKDSERGKVDKDYAITAK